MIPTLPLAPTRRVTTDRNDATLYDIQTEARITRIEDINVDGTGYKAVYVDTGDTWNVVKGQTMLSTMPYGSGYNDSVRGNDGSRKNYTNGKEPGFDPEDGVPERCIPDRGGRTVAVGQG